MESLWNQMRLVVLNFLAKHLLYWMVNMNCKCIPVIYLGYSYNILPC
jgi:hypothetical protein